MGFCLPNRFNSSLLPSDYIAREVLLSFCLVIMSESFIEFLKLVNDLVSFKLEKFVILRR